MEINLKPELEYHLAELAARDGRSTGELVEDVLSRYLEDEAHFVKAVMKGLASLDRGESMSHEEVGQRIEQAVEIARLYHGAQNWP